jgi:hypothetical protein
MDEITPSRQRTAERIARVAVDHARSRSKPRATVTIYGWVHRDGSVWWACPGAPPPLRAQTREHAHADLDLLIDLINEEQD